MLLLDLIEPMIYTKSKPLVFYKYYIIDYPYVNYSMTKDDVKTLFNEFKNFNPKFSKFNNNTILEFYYKYNKYYRITDFFSQDCRMKCIMNAPNSKDNINPFNYYQNNKDNILNSCLDKYDDINIKYLNEIMYKKVNECTYFNTTVALTIYKMLKPTNMLDFSAGWGDRLVGAIAYGTKYTGVDPSECMEERYKNIIDTLAKNKKDYKIISKPFEDVTLKNDSYDLIFTSPPFFTFEIYEDNKKQSISKYQSVQLWKEDFLFHSVDKCINYLQINGYLALYITDYKEYRYINDLLNHIKDDHRMIRLDNIKWYNIDSNKKTRVIYIWQKINID